MQINAVNLHYTELPLNKTLQVHKYNRFNEMFKDSN
jgi:hypothetical protein